MTDPLFSTRHRRASPDRRTTSGECGPRGSHESRSNQSMRAKRGLGDEWPTGAHESQEDTSLVLVSFSGRRSCISLGRFGRLSTGHECQKSTSIRVVLHARERREAGWGLELKQWGVVRGRRGGEGRSHE